MTTTRSNLLHYQTTLRDAIEFAGVGLHTGESARVRVMPAAAGDGLRFRLNETVDFPALSEYVIDTRRATVLGCGDQRVSTVEHLLSALLGMGIDNAIIDVRGPEIPVMDGSAKVFADAFAAIGLMTQPLPRRTFAPDRTHVFRDGDRLLIVMPAPAFRVRMTVDFDPPIGLQYRDLAIDPASYAAGVAPNRTFGFAHEVEALIRRGLAQGGTLENAVVFGPDGPLSELRAADEPCRHKILDLIGDFALLGAYPQCEVVAIKSGHALHCAAVRELSAHSTGLLAPAVLP